MAGGTPILLLLALAVVGQALTPASYFSTSDQGRLRVVFEGAQPYSDLATAHYSIMGLQLLGLPVPNPQETCSFLQSQVDSSKLDTLFYASAASRVVGSCELNIADVQKVLDDAITEDAKVQDLYYAVSTLSNLGLKIDTAKVSGALWAALKTDDSPLSHGYAFHAAALLSGDLGKFHDFIEDVVAQADDVDDKYLTFEGGLYTTAFVIDGAYKLSAAAKRAPVLSEDKVVKFANYFLSRKHVHQLKSASAILSVIKTFTDNQYHIPIAVTLASQVSVSEKDPMVQIRVTNLLGQSLGGLTVTADTARHLGDDAVVLSKKPFSAAQGDSSLFELNFMQSKPARGFYKLTVNVSPQKADKRLMGTSGAEIEVKVTTAVSVENVEVGVGDKDQSVAAKMTKLQHPNKAANVLEADHHQKVIMKFQLRDQTSNVAMRAHQTFVRLTNQVTRQEIIFVAEADSSDTYKFDLDVGASAKDFGSVSGKYTMDLIVGDAVIQNPFQWAVADVALSFPDGPAGPKEESNPYGLKKEIKHLFREPEKRPPQVVSMVFSGLVLAPLVILILLWLKIGANISNFPLSLSALGFHLGLAAIFGLYYCYFHSFSMFMTLRYLGIIGIPTFLFGNRLLSGIASNRKEK